MASSAVLSGTLTPKVSLVGKITINGTTTEVYNGSYDVRPQTVAQTLETANKLMKKNVNVRRIPYYETSNTS